MNKIAEFIKQNRKANGLTQEEFAIVHGLGLRFVRGIGNRKRNSKKDKLMLHYRVWNGSSTGEEKEK